MATDRDELTGGQAAHRAAFEASPDGLVVFDPETTGVVDANEAAMDMFGLSRSAFLDSTLGDLRPDDAPAADPVGRAVETGQVDAEWELRDGDRIELRFRSTTVEGSDRVVAVAREGVAPAHDASSPGRESDPRAWDHRDHLETLVENLPVVLFALDPDGTFTVSRGSALEKIGLEPGEAVGTTVSEMYADFPDVLAAAERALDGEEIRTIADLGERVFETWYRPVTDGSGDLEQVIGVSIDVTEQRERERRLEEKDAILQQLTETTDDVFWLFDGDFTEIQFVNDAYEDVWGRSVEALAEDPMDFMQGVHPEDRELMVDVIERLQRGESTQEEYRVNPEEDFQRWVSVKGEPIYDDEGELVRAAGYARDITDRKEREQRLEELQERLDLAVEGAGIGVWDWDIDTDEVLFNDAWAAMLGYSRDELDSHFDIWEQLVHPADLESATAALEAHMAGETDFYSHEIRMETKAGDWKWVQTIGRVVERDADGNPARAAGIHIDIDDRKQTEFELRRSENQFEAVFNDPQLFAGVLDTDGTIRRVNETALELAGADEADLVGMPFAETPFWANDPALQTELRGWLDRAADGEYVEFETQHVLPGKREIDVEGAIRPVTDNDGEVVALVASSRDVTERKERERQLEDLSETMEELSYAQTPVEVAELAVDITGTVLDQHVTAMWEYDADADRLVPWVATDAARDLATENDSGGIGSIPSDTAEMATFRSGAPRLVDDYQTLENPSHPEVPLGSLLLLPVGNYGLLQVGSPDVGVFGTTEQNLLSILASNAEAAFERAEREQALETYKNKLEESNENLQEFAYIASHDLQEPLRSVTSYLDLIETDYGDELDDEGQFYIQRAETNAERMSEMIDALLQYSRVKTQAGEFTTVDADAVLSDTLDSLAVLVEESGADVSVDSLPTVVADENQLGQMFQNLLKNAIDHGGDPPEVAIRAEENDDAWEFAISDNGPGIPAEQHDRIFEIFQQATTDDDSGEAGIGLAICERIVSRHHGDIWVESDDSGSTFKFTIPKEGTTDDQPRPETN